ncbi:MAG: glutathione peroxidase, partial [Planctomycetota bacterium]|nr:glutathione peroxidase [Planctomycetota bacterium]
MSISSRLAGAVAGLALSASGTACSQSMPVNDELRAKWSDQTFFDLETRTLEGEPIDLGQWKGRAVLVVNVASRCGFTRQYAGLEKLSDEFKDEGLVVVGVPCNDFGGQEPGSASQIREFCTSRYGVEFPMLAKQSSRPGSGQGVVFEYLGFRTGKLPGWNFCKYLVDPDGRTVTFFDSRAAPDGQELRRAVEKAL